MDERDDEQPAARDESPHDPQQTAGGSGQIDIERLAERIYRLMLAEAREARARGAASFVRERR